MRLTTEAALKGVASGLAERAASGLADGFAMEAVRMAGSVVTIAALAGDDAAAIRVDENARLRALFADAATEVSDSKLADWLAAAAASHDPGLRISELDAETGRLRQLLVALHAHVEEREDAAARAIDARIWSLMAETEAARAPRG